MSFSMRLSEESQSARRVSIEGERRAITDLRWDPLMEQQWHEGDALCKVKVSKWSAIHSTDLVTLAIRSSSSPMDAANTWAILSLTPSLIVAARGPSEALRPGFVTKIEPKRRRILMMAASRSAHTLLNKQRARYSPMRAVIPLVSELSLSSGHLEQGEGMILLW
jgi:hypothetical protein